MDDAERRRVWRRRGAIATVVGVGIVGLVGLLSPDRQRTGHRDGPPSVEDLGFHDDDELAPLAKALPVVTVESLPPAPPEPPPVAAPAPATRAAPKPVVVAPRPSPARSGNEALRGALRAPSPAPKTRPTLSVREDPYGKPTPPPRPAAPRQVTVFERRK